MKQEKAIKALARQGIMEKEQNKRILRNARPAAKLLAGLLNRTKDTSNDSPN